MPGIASIITSPACRSPSRNRPQRRLIEFQHSADTGSNAPLMKTPSPGSAACTSGSSRCSDRFKRSEQRIALVPQLRL